MKCFLEISWSQCYYWQKLDDQHAFRIKPIEGCSPKLENPLSTPFVITQVPRKSGPAYYEVTFSLPGLRQHNPWADERYAYLEDAMDAVQRWWGQISVILDLLYPRPEKEQVVFVRQDADAPDDVAAELQLPRRNAPKTMSEKRALLRELDDSGLSAREFCETRDDGLTPTMLYSYRFQVKREPDETDAVE